MSRTMTCFLTFFLVCDCTAGYARQESQTDIESCSSVSCLHQSTSFADLATDVPIIIVSTPTPNPTVSTLAKDATESDLPVATPVRPIQPFNSFLRMPFTIPQKISTSSASETPSTFDFSRSTNSTMSLVTKSFALSPNPSLVISPDNTTDTTVSSSSAQCQTESTSKSTPGLIAVAASGWAVAGFLSCIILIIVWKRPRKSSMYKVTPRSADRQEGIMDDPADVVVSPGHRGGQYLADRQEDIQDDSTYVVMSPGPGGRLRLADRQEDIRDSAYSVMSLDPRGGLESSMYEEVPVEFGDEEHQYEAVKFRRQPADSSSF